MGTPMSYPAHRDQTGSAGSYELANRSFRWSWFVADQFSYGENVEI